MHEAASSADPRIGLILVGFSPPRPLAAIARQLGWPGLDLADPGRSLYRRPGIGRAPLPRGGTPAPHRTPTRTAARCGRRARAGWVSPTR